MRDKQKLQEAIAAALSDAEIIVSALRERGLRRYARALALSGAILLASHQLAYVRGSSELARVRGSLESVRGASRYVDGYRELEARLKNFSESLPPAENPENWLLAAVRDSMKEEGILSTSLSPIARLEWNQFRIMTLTVTCRVGYPQLSSWISRMENSPKLLHVSKLNLRKDERESGINEVTISVASAVPKEGAAR